eukprot:9460-Heterococcus_DN1.PRE.1
MSQNRGSKTHPVQRNVNSSSPAARVEAHPLCCSDLPLQLCSSRRSMEGMNSTDGAQDSPKPAHERTAASEKPKKTYSLSNALVIAAFVAWVSKTIWGFRAILDPMRNITLVPGEPTLQNLWKQGTPMQAAVYIATEQQVGSDFFNATHPPQGVHHVATIKDLQYNTTMGSHSLRINITARAVTRAQQTASTAQPNDDVQTVEVVSPVLYTHVMANNTAYLHVFITAGGASPDSSNNRFSPLACIDTALPLTFHGPRPPIQPLRYLLTAHAPQDAMLCVCTTPENGAAVYAAHAKRMETLPTHINFWKPQ